MVYKHKTLAVQGSQMFLYFLRSYNVGVAGFEPATSSSQTRRDNRATLHPEMLVKLKLKQLTKRILIC